jgi:hypothetical protein
MLKSVHIFLGSPHRSVNLGLLKEDVVKLFCNTQGNCSTGFLDAAQLCATTILYTNHLFLESNLPLRVQIASIFSQGPDRLKQVSVNNSGYAPSQL